LINLLANGVKFTHQGEITLKIDYDRQKPHQISFKVQDTGDGIAPEEMPSLFTPFVQTQTGRRSQSGTGLGLSICHQYVQLMGGKIEVDSHLNQGSTFSFDIQIEIGKPVAYPAKSLKVIGLQPNQPIPKILVTEDRLENRQFLVRLLELVGFEVKEAVNGSEAISLWSDWSPGLILMDLQMPIMDGYEATRHIKRLNQSTVIIAITASQFKEQKQFISSSGCDDLMNLPFREEELWSKLNHHLQVEYIYETPALDSLARLTLDDENIEPKSLTIMPSKWIKELNHYAMAANAREIRALLEQIPQQHSHLERAIAILVDDFCYEQIIDLTVAAIS